MNKNWIRFGLILTFLHILISLSFWYFDFRFFSQGHLVVFLAVFMLLFVIGLFVKEFYYFLNVFYILTLGVFIFLNYNYIFIFLLFFVIGILILDLVDKNFKISYFVYLLIPILLITHILWFNFLPFGFYNSSFELDIGSENDDNSWSDLYVEDKYWILSLPQSYGDKTWREFKKDGEFVVGFNTPVNLTNRTLQVQIDYDANGPIYIDGEIFYDPLWGSKVNLGNYDETYLYGAKEFNLTVEYNNVKLEEFLEITQFESLNKYVLDKYDVNLDSHKRNIIVGKYDYYENRERILYSDRLSEVLSSGFYKGKNITNSQSVNSIGGLLAFNGVENIDEILYSPIEYFLIKHKNSMTFQEFLDSELNSGSYPQVPTFNNDYSSIEDLVYDKFPNGVLLKDFTGDYIELEEEMNSRYYESLKDVYSYGNWNNFNNKISAEFRGGMSFRGVFKDNILINFYKQDLNWAEGEDNLTIEVFYLNGTKLGEYSFGDVDSIVTKENKMESIFMPYQLNIPINESGVYTIEFKEHTPIKKFDFILKDITFNSNKVVGFGEFLLWSPSTMYYNPSKDDFGKVNFWWGSKVQDITMDNNIVISLEEKDINKWVDINLSKYSKMSFEKGFLKINSNVDYAFSSDGWFKVDLGKKIVISKSKEFKDKNIYLKNIEDFNIRSVQGTKIYSLNVTIIE